MANLTQELIAEQANAPITVAITAAAAAGIDATAHPDPANPRAALVRYTTRLNRSSFEVPFPYLDPMHLFAVALVDGEWLGMEPRFIGPQTVHLPITGDVEQVVIYRHTPRVVPTPPDGTPVTAEDLNRILLHSRYVIEEIGGALAARPSYCKMLPPGPPEITLFDVAVIGGVEAVVTWEVTGETDTLTLNGVPVAAAGVQSFPITEDTEFTLFAENVRGSDTESDTAVYVSPGITARMFGFRALASNDGTHVMVGSFVLEDGNFQRIDTSVGSLTVQPSPTDGIFANYLYYAFTVDWEAMNSGPESQQEVIRWINYLASVNGRANYIDFGVGQQRTAKRIRLRGTGSRSNNPAHNALAVNTFELICSNDGITWTSLSTFTKTPAQWAAEPWTTITF